VPDTKSYAGTIGYTDVELATKKGTFKRRVQQSETRAAWIVTDAEHDAKFLECATPILGQEQAQKVLDLARKCPQLEDVSTLAQSTMKMGSARAGSAAAKATSAA
jgi:hypothetical protein